VRRRIQQRETAYQASSRRDFLRRTALGFGSLALADLLARDAAAENPLNGKTPHFKPRANRVILLFMEGGPSHVDTIDYKPELFRRHGELLSPEEWPPEWRAGKGENPENFGPLMALPVKFSRHGKSGLWLSDAIEHIARHADDLCLINGMVTDSPEHGTAVQQFHTGMLVPRPSMGAWISYGLGSENRDLPAFVVISPPAGSTVNCGSNFLPAVHQATILRDADKADSEKIRYLNGPRLPASVRRQQLELLRQTNLAHAGRSADDARLSSMIETLELAFRMQQSAPGVLDTTDETAETYKLYGIGEKGTDRFGRQCLLARRLAEAGVRFIQVTGKGWDHHGSIYSKLPGSCRGIDKPIAGLLGDLKRRGLLEDTLVIWSGEFGRTPLVQGVKEKQEIDFAKLGRGHNPYGWSLWLAGGGVKGGFRHGRTDPFGFQAVDGPIHVHDLHATVLHLLGIDHKRLTYRHAGRDFRLTDVYGRVVKEIFA
jgi:hypothetical protein